jgi:hypothetical protein
MKIANVKSMVAKGMLAAVAAGALMIASPAKANAEQFGARIVVGYPHRDFDRYEFLRRQEVLRHEEFLRMHRFDRRYYGWR